MVNLMTVLLQTVHGTAHTARQLAKEICQWAKEKKKKTSRQPETSELFYCFVIISCTLTQCTSE